MPRKVKKEEITPDDLKATQGNPASRNGGRIQSVPGVLSRGQPKPVKHLPQADDDAAPQPDLTIPVRRHMSEADDSLISMEEFDGVRELLHPGRSSHELDARTDLNTMQILHFSRARVIAKRWGNSYLPEFINSLQRMSLSKGRKSRKELVSAIQGAAQHDERTGGILSKLGG